MSGQDRLWNEAAAIYADCLVSVAMFAKVDFELCPREANNSAHGIAIYSFDLKSDCNWVNETPSFCLQTFMDDATII
jgi:hypothetical protein